MGISLGLVGLGAFGSTFADLFRRHPAVDRVALYLIPLQLFVFARVPGLMPAHTGARTFLVFAVMAYYATVQWVWLTRADHAQYWIPYRMAAPW